VGWVFEPTCHKEEHAIPVYVRWVSGEASQSDTAVAIYSRLTLEEVLPVLRKSPGIHVVQHETGVEGLQVATCSVFAVNDTGVYAPPS
jgi:hypothetical protein